ncbi:MAG: UDP-N-acetylglucosamine 1-carboxyvinyltransferase [Alphaproteobacteria bacterium]|nr:UDP-N-acetylglucosamine 1-carboxyvinyltransferase [Alphaproteobacteria bacterium]
MPTEAENIWASEGSPSPASKHKVVDLGSVEVAESIRSSALEKLRIVGGNELNGTIAISGAKNAALKLMCASLLTEDTLQLGNMPVTLGDMRTSAVLLKHIGVSVLQRADGMVLLQARDIANPVAPYDLVRKMRASILVLGPLLARNGYAEVSLPGGCAIGTRPVDFHIEGLKAMGAEIDIDAGYIKARAEGGLTGGTYRFPKVSHTGTENLMMAATLAKGETVLENCAREPEVADLAQCLIKMGAKIEGAGSETIRVQGVPSLHGASHDVIPDRIETGTWMIAAGMTGGKLLLKNASLRDLTALTTLLRAADMHIEETSEGITVTRNGMRLSGMDIMTEPHPGFPTDLQAQMMALLCTCEGAGMITETIWENRFMHVPELCRMGANITVHGSSAIIRGVPKLKGAEVMATDLRASVALVLAGLVADGVTVVNRIYHLDRGYERIVEKLGNCGAKIERVGGN